MKKKVSYGCKLTKYNKFNDKPIFIRDDVEFHEMREFVKSIVVGYILGQFDEVRVIYNHYVNTLIQNIKVTKLLPIVEINKTSTNSNYEYDGKMEDILNMILPTYVENLVYGFVLDSKASEHASRMNSMKKATDNATEVVGKLELLYNRARQQAITLELTDIIGGASVINKK